ncbi:hypothetical protein [Prescottella equi]|uniref:hypothetical protein n=1 Tax=Rhodococcus hoagii TaxID=43767 RepID=UPI0007CD48F5|nr:hypothetical protein [Prescottella equi]ORL01580.1 hypothetical protein A6F56_04475 [Prescottella equi]
MPPYTRVNWQDGEEGGTPMSAANFNRMDKGIADLDAEAYRKPAPGIPGVDIEPGAVGATQLTAEVLVVFMFAALLMQAATQDGELVGLPRGFLAQDVQDDLGKAATAVQGSKNGTPAALKVWVGTEAQYNAATNNGANEAANTIYLRGA